MSKVVYLHLKWMQMCNNIVLSGAHSFAAYAYLAVAFGRWIFCFVFELKKKNNEIFQRATATATRVCCKWMHPKIVYFSGTIHSYSTNNVAHGTDNYLMNVLKNMLLIVQEKECC